MLILCSSNSCYGGVEKLDHISFKRGLIHDEKAPNIRASVCRYSSVGRATDL